MLHLASDATDVAMSLFSALFNIGIGAGALLGSQVAVHAGLGRIPLAAGGLGLLGTLLAVVLVCRYRQALPAPRR